MSAAKLDLLTCTICKIEQDIEEFGLRKNTSRRFRQCRSCKSTIANEWNKKNAIRRLSVHAKTRAKKHGLEFDIDFEWVSSNLGPSCPCCKKPFTLGPSKGRGKPRDHRPSLDRFDSAAGYTKQNTRIICSRCNMVKSDGTLEDHENIVRWMKAGGPWPVPS